MILSSDTVAMVSGLKETLWYTMTRVLMSGKYIKLILIHMLQKEAIVEFILRKKMIFIL